MAWMSQHKNWIRMLVFMLLLIAILGPWSYEGDGVPPPSYSHPPFLLLENGNCVGRMSGYRYWSTVHKHFARCCDHDVWPKIIIVASFLDLSILISACSGFKESLQH